MPSSNYPPSPPVPADQRDEFERFYAIMWRNARTATGTPISVTAADVAALRDGPWYATHLSFLNMLWENWKEIRAAAKELYEAPIPAEPEPEITSSNSLPVRMYGGFDLQSGYFLGGSLQRDTEDLIRTPDCGEVEWQEYAAVKSDKKDTIPDGE